MPHSDPDHPSTKRLKLDAASKAPSGARKASSIFAPFRVWLLCRISLLPVALNNPPPRPSASSPRPASPLPRSPSVRRRSKSPPRSAAPSRHTTSSAASTSSSSRAPKPPPTSPRPTHGRKRSLLPGATPAMASRKGYGSSSAARRSPSCRSHPISTSQCARSSSSVPGLWPAP